MSRCYYHGPALLVSPAVAHWQREAERAERASAIAHDAATRVLRRAQAAERKASRRESAEHESAHAVTACAVNVPIDQIRIHPNGGGEITFKSGHAPHTRREMLVVKLAALAFMRGQGQPMGKVWASASHDIETARAIAELSTKSKRAAHRMLDYALFEAAEIVDRHRDHIVALADELIARGGSMSGAECAQFLHRRGFCAYSAAPILTRSAIDAAFQWRGYCF